MLLIIDVFARYLFSETPILKREDRCVERKLFFYFIFFFFFCCLQRRGLDFIHRIPLRRRHGDEVAPSLLWCASLAGYKNVKAFTGICMFVIWLTLRLKVAYVNGAPQRKKKRFSMFFYDCKGWITILFKEFILHSPISSL